MPRKPVVVKPIVAGRLVRPGLARPAPAPVVDTPVVRPARPVEPVVATPVVTPAPARPRAPVAPSTPTTAGLRKQVEGAVSRIRSRMAVGESEFHAVGVELLALDRPEVMAAFGARTFNEFLDAHVMPSASAHRYMTVAGEFSAAQVATLGVLKAFHLVQYARVAATPFRASVLATRDVKIGKPARRLSLLSASEVADAVRMQKMTAGRAAVPKASREERRVAQQVVKQFEERFGVDAKMRIDTKRGVLRLEVKLSDLME